MTSSSEQFSVWVLRDRPAVNHRRFPSLTSSGPVVDLLFKKVIEAGNLKKDNIVFKYLNFNLKHTKEHSFADLRRRARVFLRVEVHS